MKLRSTNFYVPSEDQIAIFQPDLLLLDLRMPGMDGLELVRTVRELAPAPSNPVLAEVKIISHSASVFEDIRQQSLDAGCHDFLPKPVREQELLDMLAKHLPIQWRYEEQSGNDEPDGETSMVLPSIETLRNLREAASIGDIQHLSIRLEQLVTENAALDPFVTAMRDLLTNFQIERLHAELNRLASNGKPDNLNDVDPTCQPHS